MADLARLLLDHTDPLGAAVLVGNDNPLTVAGGINAAVGSLHIHRTTGAVCRKRSTSATGWVSVGNALDVTDFGATGVGTADDRAAFVAADAVGGLYVPPGTYRIASALTITNAVTFAPGALLKPDSGVTVTFAGAVNAGFSRIFDCTAGGIIKFGASFTAARAVSEVPAAWFGQVVGETNPTHDAIQNALDSFPGVNVGGGGAVLLLPGWNYHRKPLRMRTSYVSLRGVGGSQTTVLRGSYFGGGYLVVIGPLLAAFPTEAALATGTGSAMTIGDGSSNTYWINLRETFAAELDGLGAFCCEFFVKPRSSPGNRALITSRGRRIVSETATSAFGFAQNPNQSVTAWLKVGATTYTLTSPAASVPNGSVTHVILSYDGGTVRLFTGNTLQASAAATGTVTQAIEEMVCVGLDNRSWPQGGAFTTAADAGIDSIRISDVARYTVSGADPIPTAKSAFDANTLVLCNFTEQFDQFTKVQTKPNSGDGTAWLNLYRNTYTSGVSECAVAGLTLSPVRCSGILAFNATHTRIFDLYSSGAREGLTFWNNSYLSEMENVTVFGAPVAEKTRWGIAVLQASGVVKLSHIELAGAFYPLILQGSSVAVDDIYLHGGGTKVSALLIGDNTPLENMAIGFTNAVFSDEDMSIAGFETHVLASNLKTLTISGASQLETSLNSVPLMKLDANRAVSIGSGTLVRSKSGSTEIVNIIAANVYPVQVAVGVTRTDETGAVSVPWSTTAGAVLDNSHGNAEARRLMRPITAVTYSASITPNAELGDTLITATNGTAFTINAPTNPVTGQEWELTIKNTSGGALGVATFNAVFKMAAWTQPATGFSRAIRFRYDGTNWIEKARTPADVPN